MKSYKFIVGIVLGSESTSFSFTCNYDKNNIISVKNWPRTSENDFDGRVASSVLYREEDGFPLWGGDARRVFHAEKTSFFYAPQIRLYLTDYQNQPPIPGTKLTPVKIISDYLKQVHEHGLLKMKEYLQKLGQENETRNTPDLEMGFQKRNLQENTSASMFNISNDQICYVFSCPDDKKDTDYQAKIKNALEMAGIITPNDPEDKLRFIAESEATAFFCTTLSKEMKVCSNPYLVCNISETLGLSTIEVSELPETAKVSLLDDQASIPCGNVKLDENMRKYLKDKVTASPEDGLILEQFCNRLFDFYMKRIKTSFGEIPEDFYFNLEDTINISGTTINSILLINGAFVFPYNDMKKYIFDPVTTNILRCIEIANWKFERKITGIFLCGAIGQNNYLKEIVDKTFGASNLAIINLGDNPYATSKGLIIYGSRQHNISVPHFINKERKQKNFVRILGNESFLFHDKGFNGINKINMDNLDLVIGLDFGEFESSMSYAIVPTDDRNGLSDHIKLIKNIGSRSNSYYKTPSMLYYSSQMKYENKFGDYAREINKISTNGILLRYFKPLVARDFDPKVDDKILREIDDFELVNAISNYIRDLNKEGLRQIEKECQGKVDKDGLLYVIPFPHHWSEEARNTLMAAIKHAELVDPEYIDERVIIITDAESITCYCQKYCDGNFVIEKNQRFMICDVEERNISITIFQVMQENGDGNLVLSEITSNSSDDLALDSIDQRFGEFLIRKFWESGIKYTDNGIKVIENYFAREVKFNFVQSLDSNLEDDFKIPIPLDLNIPYDFEDPVGFIIDDDIVIPYAVMESEIFKPVVDEIIEKITRQLETLPEGERQLDTILLVGTFGQSDYLRHKMLCHFEGRPIGARFIGWPHDCDLAISRGAASFGLEPRLASESFTRYSYFLQVRDVYRDQLDDPEQKIVGYDGQEYCPNIFSEIIAKGNKIKKGSICIQRVFVTYPNNLILAIYSSDEDNEQGTPQQTITSLTSVLKLEIETPEVPELKEGNRVDFDICFEIKGSCMDVDVHYEGELLKHEVVKIDTVTRQKFNAEKALKKENIPHPQLRSKIKGFKLP